MNYIQEINSFYTWLESHPIPKSAIALWHALMAVNNKTGWISDFTVSLSALELKTGMNKTEICKARAKLESEHRIKWVKRGGNSCAVYTLLSFEDKSNCKSTSGSNCNINKLNKTKQNKTIKSNDNKLSLVINKIDDANSKIDKSIREVKSVFEKENFEAPPDAKEIPDFNSIDEMEILTGGGAPDEFEIINDENHFSGNVYSEADEAIRANKTKNKEPGTKNKEQKTKNNLEEPWLTDDESDEESRVPIKPEKPTVRVDYDRYIEYFNNNCPRLSKVMMLTPERRKAIKGIFLKHNHKTILKMMIMASESDFLSGENDRGWKATFDWLIRPKNFIKVVEGNYSNSNIRPQSRNQNDFKVSHFELIKEAYEGIMEAREIPINLNPHEI